MSSVVLFSTWSLWNLKKSSSSYTVSHKLLLSSPRCQCHHSLCLDQDVLFLSYLLSFFFFLCHRSCHLYHDRYWTWCGFRLRLQLRKWDVLHIIHHVQSLSTHCRSLCFPCIIFRLLLLSIHYLRKLLLLLLRFPLLLVLSLLHFLLALRHYLRWRSFYYFLNDLFVFFSSSDFATSIFCFTCSDTSCSVVSSFFVFLIRMFFSDMLIVKVVMIMVMYLSNFQCASRSFCTFARCGDPYISSGGSIHSSV